MDALAKAPIHLIKTEVINKMISVVDEQISLPPSEHGAFALEGLSNKDLHKVVKFLRSFKGGIDEFANQ